MKENKLDIQTSIGLGGWLIRHKTSLSFTTYQIGKVFMVGTNKEGKPSFTERTFPRCMGIALKDNTMWMSSLFQIWRFDNSLIENKTYQGYDKMFIPQVAYTTGDIDVHDMIIGEDSKPIFVNTMFNCLSTISESHSFKPLWKPPFISKLVPEDRCHLNGLAAKNGKPKYVTMVSQSDFKSGWREQRHNGGVVMDVQTNEVVCTGLSMPHSPRLHDGKLWLLNAGTGYFGYVNFDSKEFMPITFCPGFLRGLSFIGDYAIVGLSKNRENKTFEGLALDENMKQKNVEPQCALKIINIHTGIIEEWIDIDGIVSELYDVMTIPNTKNPMLIGTMKDEIQKMVSIEPVS